MGTRRFELEVRSPFRLDLTVWALRRRPHNTIDTWDGTTYRRTLAASGQPLDVSVHQEPGRDRSRPLLAIELRCLGNEPSDATTAEIRHSLERMLGLDIDLTDFYELAERDERLDHLAQRFRGVRPPRFPSVFEALVNAVACQQLSLTVGIHLLNRLTTTYGPRAPGCSAAPGFPSPESLAGAEASHLRSLGFSQAKARTILLIAGQVASGALDLDELGRLDDDRAFAALVGLPGIGRWSTEYALLRGLGRLHVLPGDDVGARNNLRRRFGLAVDAGYDELAALAAMWWPYGGMVYFHLLLDGLASAGHLETVGSDTPPSSAARVRQDIDTGKEKEEVA
ncbi:MAG: DNA-3-methyladenine glycosylase family protein [Actinomycetes bacterium]